VEEWCWNAAPIQRMPGHADFLKTLAGGDAESILRAGLRAGITRDLDPSTGRRDWLDEERNRHATGSASSIGEVVRAGELFLHGPALEALKVHIVSTVADFHKNNPLVAGISKEELRTQVDATPEVFETAAAMLVRERSSKWLGS